MANQKNRDALKGWVVLIVDDDLKSVDVVTRILRHYGATVHQAKNGSAGLEEARRLKPDFIISDLSMPEMDGWTMLSQMLADPALAKIPVIALTAHAMMGDREKVIAAGFFNYMAKPVSPATFIQELLQHLDEVPSTHD